jgi:hypothetical protein
MEMKKITVKGSWEKTFLVSSTDQALKYANELKKRYSDHLDIKIHGYVNIDLDVDNN